MIDLTIYLQVFLKTLTYGKGSISGMAINACAGKVSSNVSANSLGMTAMGISSVFKSQRASQAKFVNLLET